MELAARTGLGVCQRNSCGRTVRFAGSVQAENVKQLQDVLVVIEDDAGSNSFLRTLFVPHLLHGGATVAHPNHAELGALIAILNGNGVSAAEGVADLRQPSSPVAAVTHRGMLPKGMPFRVHTPDADGQFALPARFSSTIVIKCLRGTLRASQKIGLAPN